MKREKISCSDTCSLSCWTNSLSLSLSLFTALSSKEWEKTFLATLTFQPELPTYSTLHGIYLISSSSSSDFDLYPLLIFFHFYLVELSLVFFLLLLFLFFLLLLNGRPSWYLKTESSGHSTALLCSSRLSCIEFHSKIFTFAFFFLPFFKENIFDQSFGHFFDKYFLPPFFRFLNIYINFLFDF